MPTIEILYVPDCPNLPVARDQVRRALDALGLPASWTERDLSAADVPSHARGFGSPTVLVERRDVMGALPSEGVSCRIYADSERRGAPPVSAIVAALRGASAPTRERPRRGWSLLAAVPGVLLAALPVLSCPGCWPVYAGVLGALGVPFLMRAAWLLPLTAAALLVSLGALAFRASRRRGYGPLALGAVASIGVLAGKFEMHADALVYASLALLIAASAWNSVPVRRPSGACDACGCAV